MLKKIGALGGLFDSRKGHPLGDPRELLRIIGELPKDNAFKSLDEIAGWLESLLAADDFPADRLFEAARQLEDAATPHLRRLGRDYLQTLRLSKAEENRLWLINGGLWRLLSAVYDRALDVETRGGAVPDARKVVLPALCTRLIAALRAFVKWEQFRYGAMGGEVWQRLGRALLVAEQAGVADRPVSLGGIPGGSSALREYQKVMVFQAASMDSLLPLEIEIAERLISHFLGHFEFSSVAEHDSVYWVDLLLPQPPQRLAKMPAVATPSQRFFKPGRAHVVLQELLKSLEQGSDLPADIRLGGEYSVRTVIPVLRHLSSCLSPVPPQRKHDRHRVKHRMSVLNGLVNAFVVFSGEFGGRPAGLQIESWVVEDVSRGGFGALLNDMPGEWLKVGALLAIQPAGGDNWLLGCVRRYRRDSNAEAHVGIETLARQVLAVELRPKMASSFAAVPGVPALLLNEGNAPGEVRVVVPQYTFDPRDALEYEQEGRLVVLEPVQLVEQTADYELARYRVVS